MKKYFPLMIALVFFFNTNTSAQSTDYDKELGEAAAIVTIEKYGIYNDPKLKKFVDQIGYSLVEQLSEELFEFRFIILDDPTPNAFALLGGYVFVTRGLLALVNTPDELAGVIGHEIVHVQKRHGVKQMKHSILPTVLQLPFQIAGGILGGSLGQMVESPAATGAAAFNTSYSRRHETESDRLGIVLAARAGFDPSALSGILERIIDWEESLSDFEESRSYFSSHPYTPDRVGNITNWAPQLEWSPNSMREISAHDQLQNLLFWENPDKGVFNDHVFLHPSMDFSLTFPKDWSYTNQPTSVGATSESQTSSILMGVNSMSSSPKDLAKELTKKLKNYNRKLHIENSALLINDSTAHMVKVQEQVNKELMTLYMLWVAHDQLIYSFTAISDSDIEAVVLETANSLHSLTSSEKEQIIKYQIKIVRGQKGESFEKLNQRSGNILKEDLWHTLNGKNVDKEIKEGKSLKIIIKSPYFQ